MDLRSRLDKVKRKLFIDDDDLTAGDDKSEDTHNMEEKSKAISKIQWRSKKSHACLFCQKLIKNITRHLRLKHANEDRVKNAIVASRNSAVQGNMAFQLLRREGDALYNKKVDVKEKIMVRDSNKSEIIQQVACPYCQGFFSKKSINRHVKQSCRAERKSDYRNITGVARVKASFVCAEKCRPELINDIFPFLSKESQRNILLKDPTAISFGNTLIEKHFLTNLGGKHVHIAQQLRLLADLFNTCKLEAPEIQEIKDMFHPRYFENIISAIKARARYFHGKYGAPTTATSSCTLISKLIEHLKTRAIMSSDSKYEEALTKLEYLINHNRNNIITKIAGENRTELQRARLEKLPTTADVKKLMKVLETEFNAAYNAAKNTFDFHSYSRLCKAILAYVMAFNRKRPGDCQKALVVEFQNAATVDEDCLANLKDIDEKNRATSYYRFVTQGKLNKKSSNLITSRLKEAIDFLLQHRSEIGINTNRFLFANPKGKRLNFFRADECLKDICNKYNLNYSKLTGNKLRKHLATNTAMLPSEKQSLISNFMGHSMDVHKNIYQQSQVRTEVITMSKLLLESAGFSKIPERTVTLSGLRDDNLIDDVAAHSATTSTNNVDDNEAIVTKDTKKLVIRITPLKQRSPAYQEDSDDSEITPPRKVKRRNQTFDKVYSDVDENYPSYKEDSDGSEITPPRKVKRRNRTFDKLYSDVEENDPSYKADSDAPAYQEDSDDSEITPPRKVKRRNQTFDKVCSDVEENYPSYKKDSDDSEITPPKKVKGRNRTFDKCLNRNKNLWSTPERQKVRSLFRSYITRKTAPSLTTIADLLSSSEIGIFRPPHIVKAWIVAAINKAKLLEAGGKIRGWTTPQNHQLRKFFKSYLDKARRDHDYTYPPNYKIRQFLEKPDVRDKSYATVKSKLQHEYTKIRQLQT